MNALKKLVAALDRFEQNRPWLAFPVAVWKKFGDDQAGNLAALIAYYGFASLFPLLLVLVTVLDIVLAHDPTLKAKVLNSTFSHFPGIGNTLRHATAGTRWAGPESPWSSGSSCPSSAPGAWPPRPRTR